MSGAPLLAFGEIHTALLHSSRSVTSSAAAHLLRLGGGEAVRLSHRPIAHAASPVALFGVDCRLPTRSGARARGVGTIAGRTSITGGHVVQASARVWLGRSPQRRRVEWSHYTARPGWVEIVGKGDVDDIEAGMRTEDREPDGLDLGSIATRLVEAVQGSPHLDHRAPLRAARTRLRWTASPAMAATGPGAHFTIAPEGQRTLRVWCAPGDLGTVGDFCDDVALHDWLLSTLLRVVEGGADPVSRLAPAVEHLLHLWMPKARLTPGVAELWRSLEVRPGLSRQWRATVDRIRDRLTLAVLAAGVRGEGHRPDRA